MKFRTSYHSFRTDAGLWNNLQHHERICNLCTCNTNQTESEFHYLLENNVLLSIRKELLAWK